MLTPDIDEAHELVDTSIVTTMGRIRPNSLAIPPVSRKYFYNVYALVSISTAISFTPIPLDRACQKASTCA